MIARPKILFLIDILYSTRGGAEGVLCRITHRLPKNRYSCAVATFASEPERVASSEFDCPVYRFPIRRMYDFNSLRMAIRLSKLIRAERFSIVHCFFPAADLLGALVAKLSGCPVVISSRRDMGFQRTLPQRIAYRLGHNLFNQVQAVGEQVRSVHLRQDHLRPQQIVTVHNGADLARIDRAEAVRDLPGSNCSGEQVIACVANVRRIKALDVLIRTAAHVCRETPAARFLVIGAINDKRYYDELLALAAALHIQDKITFSGTTTDVPSLLKRCDVFCLLSRSEGLSNAMIEAMACGLPCVASDVGGNTELVANGTSGYLVPVNDSESAANSIVALLRDHELARRMGRAGREIVESKFCLDQMIATMLEQYDLLLNPSGACSAIREINANPAESQGDI